MLELLHLGLTLRVLFVQIPNAILEEDDCQSKCWDAIHGVIIDDHLRQAGRLVEHESKDHADHVVDLLDHPHPILPLVQIHRFLLRIFIIVFVALKLLEYLVKLLFLILSICVDEPAEQETHEKDEEKDYKVLETILDVSGVYLSEDFFVLLTQASAGLKRVSKLGKISFKDIVFKIEFPVFFLLLGNVEL